MPEHLRALVIILALATAVFAIAKSSVCSVGVRLEDFERRRNTWIAVTLVVFLSHNFWVFIVLTACVMLLVMPRESNTLAAYYFLLFAAPGFYEQISGLGIVNQLFTIDYVRVLALTVLLPAFLSLIKQPDLDKLGRSLPDKFVIAYLGLQFFLMLSASSFTNTLRVGVFYAVIDVLLPYYVASRSITNARGFKEVMTAFVVAAMVLALVGAYESSRHWLLYTSLENAFGLKYGIQNYLSRGESLRAMGSAGHAIIMGYIMVVATGFYLYLKRSVPNATFWTLGLLVLIVGLLVPVSRGPWMGAAAMVLVFIAAGPSPGKSLPRLGLFCVVAVPLLLLTPAGHELIDRLPFIGKVDTESVIYRQRLLQISISVIMQNPFFGAFDYFYSPAMQELKQGQGIIDIVNTYIAVALGSGLVGLSLFSGFFIVVAAGVFTTMRKLSDRNGELYLLGRTLFSVMIGILIIIFTVSSIGVIPVIYWSVAGLGVAYMRMLAHAKAASPSEHIAGAQAGIGSRHVAGQFIPQRNFESPVSTGF